MEIRQNIKIQEMFSAVSEIQDSLAYIQEYGYVGHHDVTEEDVKKRSDAVVQKLNEAKTELEQLTNDVRDQFEC